MYHLLNSVWVVPAVCAGVRARVWEHQPTDQPKLAPISEIWIEHGLMTRSGMLTALGDACIASVDLFEYYCQIFEIHYQNKGGEHATPEQYDTLRAGLGAYTMHVMRDVFTRVGIEDNKWRTLDLGCGDGTYSKLFMDSNPCSHAILIDRSRTFPSKPVGCSFHQCDFLKDTQWTKRKYNFIMLNEILHCLSDIMTEDLINLCSQCLDKEEGYIMIGEKIPTPYFQWRMDLMSDRGACISLDECVAFMRVHDYSLVRIATYETHYFGVFERCL